MEVASVLSYVGGIGNSDGSTEEGTLNAGKGGCLRAGGLVDIDAWITLEVFDN